MTFGDQRKDRWRETDRETGRQTHRQRHTPFIGRSVSRPDEKLQLEDFLLTRHSLSSSVARGTALLALHFLCSLCSLYSSPPSSPPFTLALLIILFRLFLNQTNRDTCLVSASALIYAKINLRNAGWSGATRLLNN